MKSHGFLVFGGSWNYPLHYVRVSFRGEIPAVGRHNDLGLRLVRTR